MAVFYLNILWIQPLLSFLFSLEHKRIFCRHVQAAIFVQHKNWVMTTKVHFCVNCTFSPCAHLGAFTRLKTPGVWLKTPVTGAAFCPKLSFFYSGRPVKRQRWAWEKRRVPALGPETTEKIPCTPAEAPWWTKPVNYRSLSPYIWCLLKNCVKKLRLLSTSVHPGHTMF